MSIIKLSAQPHNQVRLYMPAEWPLLEEFHLIKFSRQWEFMCKSFIDNFADEPRFQKIEAYSNRFGNQSFGPSLPLQYSYLIDEMRSIANFYFSEKERIVVVGKRCENRTLAIQLLR
jgi:hypothetical protein